MTPWFGKKKTPGGSNIIRHEVMERKFGVLDTAEFTKARETAYEGMFGKALSVSHEVLPQVPHIDVYTFRRSQGDRAVYSLVTGGMSDLEMTMPPRMDKDVPRRVELIFYCDELKEEYINTLRWLAHFPHDTKSWLGYSHTLPNGNPPAPFGGSGELDTLLLMPPIVVNDQSLPEKLQFEGEPVSFLWLVPLSKGECNLKLKKGFDAILDLFEQHRHPHVFDPHRKSYV